MKQLQNSKNIFYWLQFVVVIVGIIYSFTFTTFHVHQGGLSAQFLNQKLPFINGLFFYVMLSTGVIISITNQLLNKQCYQFTFFDGLFITYILYHIATLFWVKNFGLGLAALTTVGSFYIFYFLIKDLFRQNEAFTLKWIKYLICILAILFVLHFFISNIDVLLLFKVSDHSYQKIITQSKSWVGGKNQTACFLSLLLPLIVLLKPQKWLSVFLISIITAHILIMGSRNGYIALIVFAVVYILLNKIKLKQLAFALLLISFALLLFWAFVGFEVFINQLKNNTYSSRHLFWQQTIKMGLDNWLVGVGAGQWDFYRLQYNVWFTYKHPHNDFVRSFAELGIIGFTLFYSIIGSVLFFCIINLKQHKQFAANAIASIVVYLSLSFFDELKMKDNYNILLALIFALANYKFFDASLFNSNTKFSRFGLGVMLSMMALFLIIYPLQVQQEMQHFKHYRIYLKQKELGQAIAELKKINQNLVNGINRNPVNNIIANTYFNTNKIDSAAVYYTKIREANPYYSNEIKGSLELHLVRNKIGRAWRQLCTLYLLNPCSTILEDELIALKTNKHTKRFQNIIKKQQAKCEIELID